MNNIPDNLKNYDFLWSSCALEHIGKIRDGADFIYKAMDCLKPGGIAVHTTEYNFSSNLFTVNSGNTVLFRRRDINKIVHNLRKQGHKIEIDFTPGSLPHDNFIDTILTELKKL